MGLISFFKEPAPKEVTKSKEEISREYKHFQRRLMYSLYIGYVVSYIGRKNLSIAMPALAKGLHVSNTQLGILGGTFYATYGIGKLVNGILSDKSNVRVFFPVGLIGSAACLVLFAISGMLSFIPIAAVVGLMAFFWGVSGWFQSMTFPPIAKSLSYWFTKKDRGMKWSLVSTSHQIGVLIAVVISTFSIQMLGWQGAFLIPGAISLLTGFWLYNRLRDKPTSLGLPKVEDYKKMIGENEEDEEEKSKLEDKEEKMPYFQMFIKHILVNPAVWILGMSFLFIYVVRIASEDWLLKYFSDKGDALFSASSKLIIYSIVGAVGTMFAGFVSEKMFKGKRVPANVFLLLGLLGSLFGFALNQGSVKILNYIYISLIGLFCAGLQNLVGLHIIEVCSSKVASAANGFGGTLSYAGGYLGFTVTGILIDRFGWNGAFNYWMGCTVVAIFLILAVIPFEKRKKRN